MTTKFGDLKPKPGEDVYAREAALYGLKKAISTPASKSLSSKAAGILKKGASATPPGMVYNTVKLIQEKAAAKKSAEVAIALQDKLASVLVNKIPSKFRYDQINKDNDLIEKTKGYLAKSDYPGARQYVAKQLMHIADTNRDENNEETSFTLKMKAEADKLLRKKSANKLYNGPMGSAVIKNIMNPLNSLNKK
ncbi:MAG: hypothetical protein KKF08_18975 [Gammaproteobacteria bacterium]|nr:hypothetical protein [Gammaproteobacteria bacterium]